MFIHPKWMLQANDDGIFVKHRICKWPTARQYLTPAGVKSRLVATHPEDTAILGTRLVKVSVFEIKLLGPIPVPSLYDVKLKQPPTENELEGETLLKWPTKS